jgi:F0F1-type ATP synthase membrane subunit c/vacuolar-type H+-ATPase subunit K
MLHDILITGMVHVALLVAVVVGFLLMMDKVD